jgi:hypothetical protein
MAKKDMRVKQRELSLLDERHAITELSKGKLTTDSERHTGEGIFLSSRTVDDFTILSGTPSIIVEPLV